ncbi:hypothetical protein CHS0354_024368 [Potamilus streckersoni]|uniref:Ig-like domain-containing protein n=1 Tax=Potamilus streckersoni TaxID=2493646 RepID=A0AAE0SVE1_9BIVA|nr:hypothetical protein CHS0354_024368 [Potamilus streckersoni]
MAANKRYRPSSGLFSDLRKEKTEIYEPRIDSVQTEASVKSSFVPNPKIVIFVIVGVIVVGVIVAVAVVLIQNEKGNSGSRNHKDNNNLLGLTTASSTFHSTNSESKTTVLSAGTVITETTVSTDMTSPTTSTSVRPNLTGIWSDWGPWTSCAVTCGTGIQTRYRACQRNSSSTSDCSGEYVEQALCFTSTCPTYGKWTTWSSWSSCDLSCGNGTQSRIRSCAISAINDLDCVGDERQSQGCNIYRCPDCARSCTSGSLNADCDRCECVTTIISRVVDIDKFPLSGVVIVESATPYKTLAESDSAGSFTLNSTCSGTEILLRKENCNDKKLNISVNNTVITMDRIVLPYIISNPNSKYRLTGENVTLCCTAGGSPNVIYYEWFKDGILLHKSLYSNGTTLMLSNVTFMDSGRYNCRANSPVGCIQSELAVLSVRDSPNDFCADAYQQKMQTLPDDCVQPGTNTAQYEVGECVSKTCRREKSSSSELCGKETTNCCGVSGFRTVTVSCTGYELTLVVVTGCSCQSCISESINIQGTVVGVDSELPMKYGQIWVNGALQTTTNKFGKFSFPLSSDVRKLTITAKDTYYHQFLDMTKVFDIPENLVGTFKVTIRMFHASQPVQISSALENTIYLGNSSSNSSNSVAEIVIPPNAFLYSNGSRYDGTVAATLTFLDPTNRNTLENIPGVFRFTNNEGILQDLDTMGVFGLFFQDAKGNPLTIDGTVDMYFSSEILATDSEAVYKYKIWGLSPTDGKWELISTDGESLQRKRRQTGLFIGQIDMGSYQWYNIDKIRDATSYCYFKVRLYASYNLSAESERSFEENYVWLNFPIFRGSTAIFMYSYTQYPQTTCHRAVCDGYQGYLEVSHWDWNTYASVSLIPANPALHTNIGMDTNATTLVNYSVFENGRVLKLQFTSSSNGPFYTNEQTCVDSQTSANHFRFHFPGSDPDIYTFWHVFNSQNTMPEDEYIMARVWYPEESAMYFRVCYMRISLYFMDWYWSVPIKIRVLSYGGNYPEISGELLGIREVQVQVNSSVCIEYKCSGNLHMDYDINGVDVTRIKVFPIVSAGIKCNISTDSLANQNAANMNNVGFSVYENYVPTSDSIAIGLFRKYTDSSNIKAAKDLAYEACGKGTSSAIVFTCGYDFSSWW